MVPQPQYMVQLTMADLPPKMKVAIGELAIAHDYARDVHCDPWQFAVEISRLQELGLTASDLRWLVQKGFVSCACEVAQPGDDARRFAPGCNTSFLPATRFLLTDSGLSLGDAGFGGPILLRFRDQAPLAKNIERAEPDYGPRWDSDSGTLYLGLEIVKRFHRPSPNQTIILRTFEEDGWPNRIDDPLPPTHNIDPKRRLHDTIKWLNRNQEMPRLRFSGDGTGEGVRWKALFLGAAVVKKRRSAA